MTHTAMPKALIVGAFPIHRKKPIYGGQVSVCMRLLDSGFAVTHDIRTIDSTQISNPPPRFAARAAFAALRVILFLSELLMRRPHVVLLFLARGASVYEKGLMTAIARLLGVPVMVFPRAGALITDFHASAFHARFARWTLGKAQLFLCQGRRFQAFAVDCLGFDVECAPIIPNWTALESHLEIGRNRTDRGDPDVLRVLFLGWLEETKGVFELLHSTHQLKQSGTAIHVTFAGNGSAFPQAKAFVEQHNLEEVVSFVGWVDDGTKATLLSQCEIFVLPSWSEGLPNAMIEAMSARLACIVTDVGMISDYVVDGRDALIVQPRDVAGLTGALARLIEDKTLRREIAANGHALAASQFSLENGAKRLCKAVSQALTMR